MQVQACGRIDRRRSTYASAALVRTWLWGGVRMGRMEKAWRKKADWKRRRECSGKEKRGGRAYVKRGLGQLEGVTLGVQGGA